MNVHVTSNGRITIPVSLREKYGIKAGTRIVLTETDDGIALKPINADTLSKLRGSLKGSGALEILIEERGKDKATGK